MERKMIKERSVKRLFSVILALLMAVTLVPMSSVSVKADNTTSASVADLQLFKNVYATGSFYDVQRSPAYPSANVSQRFSGFKRKVYSGSVSGYQLADNEYMKFEYEECSSTENGAVCDDLFSNSTKYYKIKLGLYDSTGTRIKDIAQYAIFYGPSTDDGVMFCELDSYGGLLLTRESYDQSESLTYTPTIGKITLMSQLDEYKSVAYGMPSNDTPVDTWSYSGNGATLTVACNGECGTEGTHTAALTLKAVEPTYSGSDVTTGWDEGQTVAFTIEGTTDWTAILGEDSIPQISYVGTDSTTYDSAEAPSAAGTYKAVIIKESATAEVAFEVKHVFDKEVVDAEYLASEATCTAKALYYKSCECGEKGTDTFEVGEPKGHTYDDGVVTKEPTSKEEGVKTYTCTVCNATKTEPVAKLPAEDPTPEKETKPASKNLIINEGFKVVTGKKIKVSWKKVDGATNYDVYMTYCGQSKYKLVMSTKDTSAVIKKLNKKSINQKKHIKCFVVAYKMEDGKKVRIAKTIIAHAVGKKNTKATDAKRIELAKSKETIEVGKTANIKAKTVKVVKKRAILDHTREFRYASSNKRIATVSKAGKITGKKAGTCYIYVYAVNGMAKKVKVTVK